jgi:Flp pilus assembly protein TadG
MNRMQAVSGDRLKGQSLVEFSLIVVVIFIFLAGIVDLSELVIQNIVMRDAAEEGMVYGTFYPSACNQIIERVRQSIKSDNPADVNITIQVNGAACQAALPLDACFARTIAVTIDQPNFVISMPFLGTVLGRQTVHLSTSSSGMILRPPCP